MSEHHEAQPDYGTGHKKLSVYLTGVALCVVLTLLSFWAVLGEQLTHAQILIVIYASAIAQFFVQVICFLRLNVETHQGRMNVMSLVFTALVLLVLVAGSLWIMYNLNYYMNN